MRDYLTCSLEILLYTRMGLVYCYSSELARRWGCAGSMYAWMIAPRDMLFHSVMMLDADEG